MTIVQLRDKTSDTSTLIATGKRLHTICQQHKVPLIINDRVDVALAVGCEGVHLGQDDMSITSARQILGHDKVIGATVSSVDEARIAVESGADYLGIGTLYATATKKNTKDIIGINGIRKILHYLDQENDPSRNIKTVCIGGVNGSNIRLIHQRLYAPSSVSQKPKTIDGVAVVSAIIAAKQVQTATEYLRLLISESIHSIAPAPESPDMPSLFQIATEATRAVHNKSPLSHNMTNLVVQNFAASVALAIGASPIMSNNGDEAADLAAIGGGLVINMGTATPDALANHRKAIVAYNAANGPIVLDPVGAGATSARKEALAFLMASGYFDLIKGNEREIMEVARASGFMLENSSQQRGVDSGSSVFTHEEKAYIVSRIALRERNIVLMTGAVDLISDGARTYSIANGHKYLGMVTGSGCTLGTTLAAYLATKPRDKLFAVIGGIIHYEYAAEVAAVQESVKGPGTFIPAFIDALYSVRMGVVEGWGNLVSHAQVKEISDIPDAGLLREL